jgi:ABC-type transport system substrate-binding protein
MLDIGKVANTLIPETNPYYERSLYRDDYSPQQALQTLLDAGWQLNRQTGILEKAGQPLSFKLYFTQNSYLEESIARMVKVDLAELNINVEPVPIPPDAREALLERSNYMSMIYHYSYDPRYLFEAFTQFYFDVLGTRQRVPNYQNRYLTRLYDLVKDKEDLHKNFYQRFQKFVVAEIPAVFLFFDERILIGVDKRFQDYRSIYQENRRYFYRMNPVENWYVPKDLQKYDK